MLWNLWHYVSDNRSRDSDLKKVPGIGVEVGVVVFQNARSRIIFLSDSATLHTINAILPFMLLRYLLDTYLLLQLKWN